ncbi:hypothetical protein RB595_006084 [Gaeumannomyces hyphopodioides]
MLGQPDSYRSPFAPKYHYQPNLHGFTVKQAVGFGVRAGGFGAVALGAVIFFASGIPRVQKDVLAIFPPLAKYYHKEIPASDNPF